MNDNKIFVTIERDNHFSSAIYCHSYRIKDGDSGKELIAWVIDPNGCMCQVVQPIYYSDTITCEYVRG